ncbi:MAG: hypothetical protein H6748_11880 [Spirochaetaceae bacterium]|nr:hypothetical protein [Myxococcales bacterium]MCB9724737.1 hypothetical protein [Spirochaetaceae bacterium]HPG24691.1 hypothetical protein [Myxococcota bacterium]
MEDHDSPEARRARRRARRWKRRARIAGPLLALPLVLGALALSIDLVEYRPAEPPERLSDRPMPSQVAEPQPDAAKVERARTLSSASVMSASGLHSAEAGMASDGDEALAFDWARSPAPFQAPTPPSMLGSSRR